MKYKGRYYKSIKTNMNRNETLAWSIIVSWLVLIGAVIFRTDLSVVTSENLSGIGAFGLMVTNGVMLWKLFTSK